VHPEDLNVFETLGLPVMLEMLEIATRYLVAKQNSCYISSTEWQPRSRGRVVLNGDVKLTIFNISWSNAGASS
jgi:hypothetical protein